MKTKDLEQYEVHRHLHTHEKLIKVFDGYVKTLPGKKIAKIGTICRLACTIPDCVTPEQLATCTHNCAKSGHRDTLVRDIRRVDQVASILMQNYLTAFGEWLEGEAFNWRWDLTGVFFYQVCLSCGGPNRSDLNRCRACDPEGHRRDDEAQWELSLPSQLAADESIHRPANWE